MKKIFIADDNSDLLELMRTFFRHDYNVYCCADSQNLFHEIAEFEPDLVIMDNFLGDMNAETIKEKLKKKDGCFSVPFLLFSAHPSIREIAAKMGADGYIEKPFVIRDVKAYVHDIIQKISSDLK